MKIIIISIMLILSVSLCSDDSKINQELFDAVCNVDVNKVKTLLDSGGNPNWAKKFGKKRISILQSWIVYAYKIENDKQAEKKLLEIVALLFKKGAKLASHDGAILYFPIVYGYHDLVELYIKNGASPTKFSKRFVGSGVTPIELAAKEGRIMIQALLIKNGAKALNNHTIIQLQFIDQASYGQVVELEKLIKAGARINEKNRNGETALINSICIPSNHFSNFFFLLKNKANVNLEGDAGFGKTFPLHKAIYISSIVLDHKETTFLEKEISKKVLNSLISAGAHVSSRNQRGETPLHIAVRINNFYAAKLLLKNNSKVMTKDNKGKTPLYYAERGEMIKLLKENGAEEQ